MKTFREIQIAANIANGDKFGVAIEAVLSNGWTRFEQASH